MKSEETHRGATLMFATGGTGGHIFPAIAVARTAERRGYRVEFLGQEGGMEARLVPEAGFIFHGVAAGKWDRQRPDPRQAGAALAGLWRAVRITHRLAPQLVVGFGGFASFPGSVAASLLGRPLVLHEGNAFPGRVTRWFAARARAVITSQPAAARYLQGAKALHAIGYPVREQRVERQEARQRLGLPHDGVVTLVMGGSQGSIALNEAVTTAYLEVSATLDEGVRHTVLHSTGPRWLEAVEGRVKNQPRYHLVGFVEAPLAWSAADLAITRGGNSTLAEAAYHGVPLVMIPLPTAAEDHQAHNARAVEAAGAGTVVNQGDQAALVAAWRRYLELAPRRSAAEAAAALSPEGAASAFVDLFDELLAQPAATTVSKEPA